ncbi:MAG: hypothetical protein IKF50_07225 [Clostridia bacterium]|nr:hypothetical protein [Clostridia bacterium]
METKTRYGKLLLAALFILIASVVAGYLLLALSFAIPFREDPVRHDETVAVLDEEGLYPRDKSSGRPLDNWADSYSVLIAAYDGDENAFEKAAAAYHIQSGYNPYEWLSGHVDEVPEQMSYARYWHGYLLFLRPLMTFLNIRQIRNVNTVCLFAVILAVLILMMQKLRKCVVPFLCTLLFLAPTAMGSCFEYSRIFYISLFMCALILFDPGWLRKETGLLMMFLAGGILTAYLDFLSAPLLTLSVPLTVYCVREENSARLLRRVLLCCVFWAAGYAGMWAGKWIIALLFQRRGFLYSLFYSIQERSSTTVYNIKTSRIYAIRKNFAELLVSKKTDLLPALYALFAAAGMILYRRRITKRTIRTSAVLLFIAFFSVAWYFILANHSIVHFWLHAYRTGATSVFAVLCALDAGNITTCPENCGATSAEDVLLKD